MAIASRKGGKTFVDQKDSALALARSVAAASEEKAEAKSSKVRRPTPSITGTAVGPKRRNLTKDTKSRNRAKLDAAKAQLLEKRKDKARTRKDKNRQRNGIPDERADAKGVAEPPRKRVSFA